MDILFLVVGVIGIYLAIQLWILPKLGIET